MAATVSSSGTGGIGRLTDDGRYDLEVAAKQCIERGERMADRAEIGAGDKDERQLQRHHQIEHGALVVERHHDAADAFDQQDVAALIDGGPAKGDDAVDIDDLSLAFGGKIGR